MYFIPIQTDPDFSNPMSHLHRYAPSVFSQLEFAGQGNVSISVHSLTSIEQLSPCQPDLQTHDPSTGLQASAFSRSHAHVSSQLLP